MRPGFSWSLTAIFAPGGPAARYLFWGALVLVAGFLVWLVARLLPRPPAS